jgi:hypothetical protein
LVEYGSHEFAEALAYVNDHIAAHALLVEYGSHEFAEALAYVNDHIAAHRTIHGKEQPMILFGWQQPDSVPYRYNVLHLVTGAHVLSPH